MATSKGFSDINEKQWTNTNKKPYQNTILILCDSTQAPHPKFKEVTEKLLEVKNIKFHFTGDTSKGGLFKKMLGRRRCPLICLVIGGKVLSDVMMSDESSVSKFLQDIPAKLK